MTERTDALVNELTLEYGDRGRTAVQRLLDAGLAIMDAINTTNPPQLFRKETTRAI